MAILLISLALTVKAAEWNHDGEFRFFFGYRDLNILLVHEGTFVGYFAGKTVRRKDQIGLTSTFVSNLKKNGAKSFS